MSREMRRREALEVDESETTENYEYAVKIMRRLLQSVGMWPVTSPTYPNFLRLFLIAAVCFLLAFYMIPGVLHTFVAVKSFTARTRNLAPLSFGLMNIIKFAILVRRRTDLRECLDWLLYDWCNTKIRIENELMLASARTGVTFTTACVSFMFISGMTYSSGYSFIQERPVVNNVTLRVIAYPAHFMIFDPQDHFYKIYLIQSMCGLAAFTTTSAVASIAIAITMHVCGQISVISHLLHNLASGTFDKEIFQYILDKHLRALSLANKLESLLCGICLVEVAGCCFIICTVGYYLITEFTGSNYGPYIYCLLLVTFTFDIFTFCYIGEQLSEQCSNVGTIVYNIDWYYLSPADTRALIMMILSANRPVVLTAGKMTILSMRSFTNVMKAALSYLNMLRAVGVR